MLALMESHYHLELAELALVSPLPLALEAPLLALEAQVLAMEEQVWIPQNLLVP